MRSRLGLFAVLGMSLAVGVTAPAAAQTASPVAPAKPPARQAFVSPAVLRAMQGQAKGDAPTVPVIVSFDTRGGRTGQLSTSDVGTARASVLSSLPTGSYELVSTFQRIPAVSLAVNEASLTALRQNPLVHSINADQVVTKYMTEANALTGVASVHSGGVTGNGAVVAIIDTGVDSAAGVVHPALVDDLAGQACFRTEDDCIGGATSAEDQDGHGTHVAGIITGPQGVAPDAQFYALKVFTTGNTSDTNILNALDHVIGLNNTTPGTVDLVNMSLGGNNFPDQATCDANSAAYVTAFSALNAQGVTVFVATGNDAEITEIGSPGCVTGAVGVGSVGDTTFTANFSACTDNAVADKVSCFSNATPVQGAGELVDLMAPGCSIVSTGLDGSTTFEICGTSMATPYAAGAAALLVEYLTDNAISMTPAQIEEHMEATGVQIGDYRMAPGAPTFPRVSPPNMIGSLAVDHPTSFTITSVASNSVSTAWTAATGATEYRIYASADGGTISLAGTVAAPTTTFVDASPECGTLTYFVRSFDGAFESLPSNTDTATARACPLAPSALQLTAYDADSNDLQWTDNNPDETGNILQRQVNGGGFTDYQTFGANVVQFTDEPLACGVYSYRVVAVRNSDRSAPSNVVQRGICAPTNDDFANAEVVVADTPYTDVEPNQSYGTEEALDPIYSCHFSAPGPGFQGVWYTITPAADTRVTVSTAATTLFAPSSGVPDTLVAIFTGAAGSLAEVACNDDIGGSNFRSTVSSNLAAGTTYKVFVSQWVKVPAGTVGNLSTAFSWSAPIVIPANDLVANAIDITTNPFTGTVTNAQNATTSGSDLPHSCAFNGPRVGTHTLWWTFTPPVNGTIDVDTLASSGSFTDTILTVYTGAPGSFSSVACNDDEPAPGATLRSEILGLAVTGGTEYTIYTSRWISTPTATVGTEVLALDFTASPGVTVSPTTVDVAEAGASDTYSVVLNTMPTADVIINIADDADCDAFPLPLTFTDANWNVPQTVTVYAVDDLFVEGPHTCTIQHTATSADADYNGIPVPSVTGNVTDKAAPTVQVTVAAGPASLPEPGGAFTFTVTVENLSTTPAEITSITDDNPLSAGCLALVGTVLDADDSAPGGTDEATCTNTATHTDAGSYSSTTTVVVADVVIVPNAVAGPATGTDSDTVTVTVTDVAPDVAIVTTANPTSVPDPGANVTFTNVVTNNSVETVTITVLTDTDFNMAVRCPDAIGTSLAPGGTYTCTYTELVSGTLGSAPHSNTATVVVRDNEDTTDTASDDATVAFTASVASPPAAPPVTDPPATVPPATDAGRQLPATGSSIEGIIMLGLGLVVLGTVLARRRGHRGAPQAS